ncbi:F0F1 ATP synthase subunit B family protein [Sphingomonas aestuarii]
MANPGNLSAGSLEVQANLSEAAKGQGMGLPDTGAQALTAAGTDTPVGYADPAIFGVVNATVVVSLAMAVFLAILIWKKVPSLIARGLDNQIAAIKARLDEAKALRAEAEALRDEYAQKIASIEAQAAEMVQHAEAEAQGIIAKAEVDAAELTARRARMAEDKIASAERTAIAEIRAKAADAAARAATAIIADKHGAAADKTLVDRTIAGLSRLN